MNIFKIKSKPELEFRPAFKSAVEILSFQLTANFKDPDAMTKSLVWLLERTEVCLAGSWVPVKEPNAEVYNPAYISEQPNLMNEICVKMFEYVQKVFQTSAKSN